MKLQQATLVCFCLLGLTHVALSQVKASTTTRGVPGYLDPATGKFTTSVTPTAEAQATSQAGSSTTSIFFREDFQITVSNYDQPTGGTAVCNVDMSTYDSNGSLTDSAAVIATPSGSGWTCDVPVLTLWNLSTPTSDSISATVTFSILPQNSSLQTYGAATRTSSRSYTLSVPGNAQTVATQVNFQL